MFTQQQRQRFRALQRGKDEGTLRVSEQAELQVFVQQIEAEEAVYLRPANERMRQEWLQLKAQTETLKILLRRRERLAHRLERVLALSALERAKINTELSAILGASASGAAQ